MNDITLSDRIYKYLLKQDKWVSQETIFTVAMNKGFIVPAVYDALKVLPKRHVNVGVLYMDEKAIEKHNLPSVGTYYRAYPMTKEEINKLKINLNDGAVDNNMTTARH